MRIGTEQIRSFAFGRDLPKTFLDGGLRLRENPDFDSVDDANMVCVKVV